MPGDLQEAARLMRAMERDAAAVAARKATQPRRRSATPAPTREAPVPTVDVDQLLARLTTTGRANGGRLPGLVRAVEHMVADLDAASAATPHGTVALGETAPPDLVAKLNAAVESRVANLLGRLGLLVVRQVQGWPSLPLLTVPEAGAQGGQKQAVPSTSFTVGSDPAPMMIDAAATLNISAQLDAVAAGVVDALLRIAVVAEAEAQVVAAIESAATTTADLGAAFGTFDGGVLYAPAVVVVPPSGLLGLGADVQALTAAGVQLAVVASATQVTVLDPGAVLGVLADANVAKVEPSLLGRTVASMIFGSVSVNPAGAATVTAP